MRGRSKRLTGTTVGGFVATVLRMISGVRGDRAGVSVEWPGADVTHYHQNGGGNKKQRRGSTRHRGCSVMTRRFAVKRRGAARTPRYRASPRLPLAPNGADPGPH